MGIRVIPDRIMTTPLSWVNGAPLTTTAGANYGRLAGGAAAVLRRAAALAVAATRPCLPGSEDLDIVGPAVAEVTPRGSAKTAKR